jgi:hypothetical protein
MGSILSGYLIESSVALETELPVKSVRASAACTFNQRVVRWLPQLNALKTLNEHTGFANIRLTSDLDRIGRTHRLAKVKIG